MEIKLEISHLDKLLPLEILGGVEQFNSKKPIEISDGIQIRYVDGVFRKGINSPQDSEFIIEISEKILSGVGVYGLKVLATFIWEKIKSKKAAIKIEGDDTKLDFDDIWKKIQDEVKKQERNSE